MGGIVRGFVRVRCLVCFILPREVGCAVGGVFYVQVSGVYVPGGVPGMHPSWLASRFPIHFCLAGLGVWSPEKQAFPACIFLESVLSLLGRVRVHDESGAVHPSRALYLQCHLEFYPVLWCVVISCTVTHIAMPLWHSIL